MNNIKKLGILLLAIGVITGFARAATQPQFGQPDAILRLKGGSFAAGIGFSWGSGTLTYKGKGGPHIKDQAGVTVVLRSTQRGVDVNATGAGVDMQLKR